MRLPVHTQLLPLGATRRTCGGLSRRRSFSPTFGTDIYMDVPFAFAINNFVPLCTVLYVCIYIHIYIYIYIYVYMYMYVYMYACMYVCTYVRTYVCMYACVYTCIYVCMYPYAYMFMYVYTHMYVCISILQERLPLARMVYV